MSDKQLVIKIGSKQFLAKPGAKLVADRLNKKEGEAFELADLLDKEPVKLKVIAHTLGKKIHGLKFKNKIHYLRRYGHRQSQTILEVLSVGREKAVTEKSKAKEENLASNSEEVAKKPIAAKKSAAAKPTAKKEVKKVAAKKPAVKKTPTRKAKKDEA